MEHARCAQQRNIPMSLALELHTLFQLAACQFYLVISSQNLARLDFGCKLEAFAVLPCGMCAPCTHRAAALS